MTCPSTPASGGVHRPSPIAGPASVSLAIAIFYNGCAAGVHQRLFVSSPFQTRILVRAPAPASPPRTVTGAQQHCQLRCGIETTSSTEISQQQQLLRVIFVSSVVTSSGWLNQQPRTPADASSRMLARCRRHALHQRVFNLRAVSWNSMLACARA